jgi:hypothetical protein
MSFKRSQLSTGFCRPDLAGAIVTSRDAPSFEDLQIPNEVVQTPFRYVLVTKLIECTIRQRERMAHLEACVLEWHKLFCCLLCHKFCSSRGVKSDQIVQQHTDIQKRTLKQITNRRSLLFRDERLLCHDLIQQSIDI